MTPSQCLDRQAQSMRRAQSSSMAAWPRPSLMETAGSPRHFKAELVDRTSRFPLRVQFGAACGLLVGHGVQAMAARIAPEEQVSLSLYAVVGAAAFLSGCVRYKSTAILIAMESTGAFFLIVPIAIAGGVPKISPNHSRQPCPWGF